MSVLRKKKQPKLDEHVNRARTAYGAARETHRKKRSCRIRSSTDPDRLIEGARDALRLDGWARRARKKKGNIPGRYSNWANWADVEKGPDRTNLANQAGWLAGRPLRHKNKSLQHATEPRTELHVIQIIKFTKYHPAWIALPMVCCAASDLEWRNSTASIDDRTHIRSFTSVSAGRSFFCVLLRLPGFSFRGPRLDRFGGQAVQYHSRQVLRGVALWRFAPSIV